MNETIHDGEGRMVEQTLDNGDGTGTRTTYDVDGNVTSTEALTGLPVPDPEPPTIESLQATVDELLAIIAGEE